MQRPSVADRLAVFTAPSSSGVSRRCAQSHALTAAA